MHTSAKCDQSALNGEQYLAGLPQKWRPRCSAQALEWHPDRAGPSKRKQHEDVFRRINAAYSDLTEGPTRARSGSASSSSAGQRGQQQQQQQYYRRPPRGGFESGYARPGGGGFSQEDAERVFKEFFGGRAAEDLFREMHRAAEEMQRNRRGGAGGLGGMGVGPQEWDEMVRNRMGSTGGPHATEVQEYTYRRSDGKIMRRRVTRRHMPGGQVHEDAQEDVVDGYDGRSGSTGGRSYASSSGRASPMSGNSSPLSSPNVVGTLFEVARRTVAPVLMTFLSRALQSAYRGALQGVIRRFLGRGRR